MEQILLSRPASKPAPSVKASEKASGRLLYIDNLRWVMIMLVVSMHAAVTYSHLGSWYYMEDTPVSLAGQGIFGTYQAFLQSFFMGFLFFIAGYFVPKAYDTKGPGKFLKDRALRLGLPLLLYLFLLQPVSIYCISLFHGPDVGGGLGEIYGRYITSGRPWGGTGPLWFCEALLIFCLGYTLFRTLRGGKELSPAAHKLPGNAIIWGFIALIGITTFWVRLPWPNGTSFYNLQFCYFPQYILFFIAGTLAYRGNWLNKLPAGTGKYWGRVGLFGGLAIWAALLILGGAFKGQLPAYQGGLHWQSMGMSCWEQVAGVGISIYFLIWFRERYNQQGAVARWFSANAFAVYVFHAPVLIAISRMMGGWHGPILLKFLLLTLLSILATYALCALVIRRIPLLRRIL
ncbi:MAG TPA: acyltransferase family protein [Puia sp.]